MIRQLTDVERRAINVLGALVSHPWPPGGHVDLVCYLTGGSCETCGGPMYSYVGVSDNNKWCLLDRNLTITRYPSTYLVVRQAVESLLRKTV